MEAVRRLGVALLLLTAGSLALTAQSGPPNKRPPAPPNGKPYPPNTKPYPPNGKPHPHPSGYGYRPYQLPYGVYPAVTVNGAYATPAPKPKHTKAPAQNNYGQEVFSTHSTEDNSK